MEIIVESNEIKKLANQMKECSNELEDEIRKIINIVDSISEYWSGDDASKYINILQEKYILGLEELNEIIDEYATYLNNIPQAYELLEDVYSGMHMEV